MNTENSAANYIERFNIPTVLMAMFTVGVTFVDSCYMEFFFLMLFQI